MAMHRRMTVAVLALAALTTSGCADVSGLRESAPAAEAASGSPSAAPTGGPASEDAESPAATPPAQAAKASPATPKAAGAPARKLVDAELTIPAIDIEGMDVVAYRGTSDDAEGTLIQNEGVAAAPISEAGGEGPGEVGNYIVTAHRNSAGAPFLDIPELENGDRVLVTAGGKVYDYVITDTRTTSFRSKRSLAEQRAAVPGRPGRAATKAMITLSTCRTQEDHAEGNFWSDEFDNPEHRIDKIGVLAAVRDA
jgi:sortase A